MPPTRSIKDFFNRPLFALTNQETPSDNSSSRRGRQSPIPSDSPATSPLTEPPSSSPLAKNAPGLTPNNSTSSSRIDELPLPPVKRGKLKVEVPQQQSFLSTDSALTEVPPAEETSFTSSTSHRTIKNGKEVVTGSDGEDADSITSLEAPEDLFAKLVGPESTDGAADGRETKQEKKDALRPRRKDNVSKTSKFSASNYAVPTYKNTLDALVTEAVDDNETEAGIAKLKATLKKAEKDSASVAGTYGQNKQLHEGMLTSALGDKSDELEFQRLLDAVRRTEAFEQDKTWSFFSKGTTPPPGPEFPRDSVAPASYLAVLRESESRERAFHSGIVDFALSKGSLPGELVMWIFNAVPSEPRDELRHAYCRAFKSATAELVRSLIHPNDIDMLFQRLGARSQALEVTEPISPDPPDSAQLQEPHDRAPLLSVLEMLRGAADLFADDTREQILMILFRLTLDVSLTKNNIVCSELEKTITAVLEEVPEESVDQIVHRICITLYNSIKEPAFQSRLLKHTLPTSSWIALLRCRLAVAYLLHDPSPLTEPADAVLNIQRIIEFLRDPRFDVKKYKGKGRAEYDYSELGSITTLLNIAIDAGWTGTGFPTKEAEKTFNAEIDVLADRIKKIFASIEDSGVSHLKRTLAKEGLEALHYRVLYSIRSRPPPKKTLFRAHVEEGGNKKIDSWIQKREKSRENTEMPIREHESS